MAQPDPAQKAFAVAVLADETFAFAADRVDGADERGVGRDLVEVAKDGNFVRDGQVDPAHAEGPDAGDGIGQAVGRNFDGEIAPIQTESAKSGLLHRSCGVLSDWLTETGDQFGFEIDGHSSILAALRQAWRRHSCRHSFWQLLRASRQRAGFPRCHFRRFSMMPPK
jgi:hypothetical protein